MSKAIVRLNIPTDYADEYKQWIIEGRLCYLEDNAWTCLKEVEYEVELYKDAIQLNLRVPSNEIVKAVENSVIDTLYAQPPVKAIPIEQLLSILPEYDDYIHMKTYPYNETMEDIYSKGYEDGWNVCLKIIKEELEDWEKENEERTNA